VRRAAGSILSLCETEKAILACSAIVERVWLARTAHDLDAEGRDGGIFQAAIRARA
jgi:hypothetical protein